MFSSVKTRIIDTLSIYLFFKRVHTMGGISIWQLAIIVLLVVLLFGTKKLRNLGSDLGESVKGFKKAMNDDKAKDAEFEKVEQKQAESTEQKAKDKEQA